MQVISVRNDLMIDCNSLFLSKCVLNKNHLLSLKTLTVSVMADWQSVSKPDQCVTKKEKVQGSAEEDYIVMENTGNNDE